MSSTLDMARSEIVGTSSLVLRSAASCGQHNRQQHGGMYVKKGEKAKSNRGELRLLCNDPQKPSSRGICPYNILVQCSKEIAEGNDIRGSKPARWWEAMCCFAWSAMLQRSLSSTADFTNHEAKQSEKRSKAHDPHEEGLGLKS